MNLNEDLTNAPADKTPDVVELDAVEIDSPRAQTYAGGRNGARYKDSPNCQKPDIFIAQDTNCCTNCCMVFVLFLLLIFLAAIF